MNTLLSAISLLSSQQLLALLEMATTCAMLTVWALELLVGRHLSLIVRSLAGIVLALRLLELFRDFSRIAFSSLCAWHYW